MHESNGNLWLGVINALGFQACAALFIAIIVRLV